MALHRSAGASLRRHNEAALMTEMRDLMTSWSHYCAEAHCIFIQTPKHNRGLLVGEKGGKAPFVRGDPRLRHLPFPTRRPTLKEVQAAHTRLASIYVGVAKGEGSGGERSSKNESRGRKRNDVDVNPPKLSNSCADVGGPDVGGPDVGSLDVGGPDVGGPDVGGPDVGGPDVGGLDVGGPDVGGPDVGGRDVGGSDVGGPDVGGPDDVAKVKYKTKKKKKKKAAVPSKGRCSLSLVTAHVLYVID